jgi:hypothetical protein
MERFQAPNTPGGIVEITDSDLIRFLLFCAGLWFKTNHYLKAGRALLAALSLWLAAVWSREDRVQLQEEALSLSIRDSVGLVIVARDVFASMANFEVHPFTAGVLKEMEKEANGLLSCYLLAVYQQEELCG